MPYREIAAEEPGEPSAAIRPRVIAARERQHERQGAGACNARLPGPLVRKHCKLDEPGRRLVEEAVNKIGLSARAHDRILKVARTIADLDGAGSISKTHVGEAIQYRVLDRPLQS